VKDNKYPLIVRGGRVDDEKKSPTTLAAEPHELPILDQAGWELYQLADQDGEKGAQKRVRDRGEKS